MKYCYLLSVILLAGCTQQAKVPDYSVEFLSDKQNKAILDKLKKDCLLMQSADKPAKDSIASVENCANARVAIKLFQQKFNSSSNTDRRVNTKTFGE